MSVTTRSPQVEVQTTNPASGKAVAKPRVRKSPAKRAARSAKPKVAKPVSHVDTLLNAHRDVPGRLPGIDLPPVAEFPGSLVEAGRQTVYLRSTGTRPPDAERQAVFVHGLGGSARNWTDLMYLLAPIAPGIAPDLLGFGKSPMPQDRDYSQAAHAAAVIRLIEDRSDLPVDLFGNSMGGAISIRIAAQRPDLVRSLVLISPALPTLRPRPGTLRLLAMTTPGVRNLTSRLMGTQDAQGAVDFMHELCYANPGRVSEERRKIQVEETQWRMSRPDAGDPLRLSARGLAQAFVPGRSEYLWSMAERVECPTLAVFGSHDKLVDPRLALRAARTFRNGRVVTLPDTGHVAQLERPETVARMVLTMWAETHS